jgi:hypothetical protein
MNGFGAPHSGHFHVMGNLRIEFNISAILHTAERHRVNEER